MANDFSADPDCVALYRWENGGITTDSKGTNTLTMSASNPVSEVVKFQEGSASVNLVAAGPNWLYRTDASLSASFPFKSGTANKTISACVWVRFKSLPGVGAFMNIGGKTSYAGGARTMSMDVFNNAGTVALDTDMGKADGSYSNNYGHASGLSVETWYHVTYGYRDADQQLRIFLRDAAGATIGSDVSLTTTDPIGLFAGSDFMWGTVGTNASPAGNYGDLYLDEGVIFKKLLTANDATNIAKGLYTGSGDEGVTPSAQTLTLTRRVA